MNVLRREATTKSETKEGKHEHDHDK